MKDNMFYGAGPLIFQRAEELQNSMTPAEEILWNVIHINEWKVKFRRQHPIANYVVDFYCHSVKLVIELDGGIHDTDEVKINDEQRELHLKELGLTVLRFKNEDVFKRKKNVLETISNTLKRLKAPLQGMGTEGERHPLYVVKIGGNIIDNEAKLISFLRSFASLFTPLQGMGAKAILIHGGGKLATKLAAQLGVEQQLIDGRRITDAETLKIVTMVYAGYINKNIVAQLQANGCNAIGLCGADGNIIQAHKRPPVYHPQTKQGERNAAQEQDKNKQSQFISPPLGDGGIDYGFVGDVDEVNTSLLKSLLDQDVNVVLAPITHDKKGVLLNTNADTIAQEIAQAMSGLYEVHLIYSFEKAGVLLDANDDATVIPLITPSSYKDLKERQLIFAGMLPKLDNAFAALDKGVARVVIGKAEELEHLVAGDSGTSIGKE